ncbi:MAG: hypothetical protein NC301_09045 [Bacteroides sp.]|nr:hypothetical protein [Alistipes timonensis]MCM1311148.1 hypothetical protein [Bacteroides sp.]MCM1406254.1 hypothetical protein [[Clostridium] fimetarium]
MENNLISITGKTVEWTEGNHGALEVKLRRGASCVVKCDRCRDVVLTAQPDYDTWCRAEFHFCKRGVAVPYSIEIYSESTGSLLEMVDVLWDTKVEAVLMRQCPSLVGLRFHNVNCFDFSGCPNLESLDCDYFKGEILDLTALPRLKSLQCRSGEAATIDLSKSPELSSLDLCGCKMTTLKVSNQAKFDKLSIDYCDKLKRQTRMWMEWRYSNAFLSGSGDFEGFH